MISERKVEALKGAYRIVFKSFYEEMMTKRMHPGKSPYSMTVERMDEIMAAAKKECWKEFH